MTRPYGSADPYPRGSALSRSFLPLALITLGVVFLLSNLVPERARGGLIVLGLGAAFIVGRITTGRYGYAVPGGILAAIGAYIVIHDVSGAQGLSSSGLFFVLLGLGFALVYVAGLRPIAIWPLFPAVILVALGLLQLGVASLGPLASWSWIAAYWPLALVLLGVWLLLRESLPSPVRAPIATFGGLALLAYGIVAAAASVAAGGALERAGVPPALDAGQFADTITLEQPISPNGTFTVTNSSGSTTIHGGSGTNVRVVANRHFAFGQPPNVTLTPSGDNLTLQSSGRGRGFPFGGSGGVDYTIDVPAGVAVTAQSSSGPITVSGVSGVLRLSASSGAISVSGLLTNAATVSASSGSVNIQLQPGSAEQLNVHTGSGSIEPHGLVLTNGVTRRNELTGSVGAPAPGATLSVQTSSGSVTISG
jgi:putative adhesin